MTRGITLKGGLLRYNSRVVIGEDEQLKKKILQSTGLSYRGSLRAKCNIPSGEATLLLAGTQEGCDSACPKMYHLPTMQT